MNQSQKHRDACDACHYRKIRCPFVGPGACSNCQNSGRVCAFSPRDEMGRPKRSNPKKGREGVRKRSTTKSSPPKKQESPDRPIPPATEDEILPDVPHKEGESSISAEVVELGPSDDWQHLLSFPIDENDFKDFVLYDSPTPSVSNEPMLTPTQVPHLPCFQPQLILLPEESVQLATPALSTMPMLIPPVSFNQQNEPPTFESLSNNTHDFMTDPPPPSTLKPYNSLPPQVSHGSMDSSLETHRLLSNILYGLRLEYGKQWSTPETESPRRDGIFRSVSLLCDIVQEVLADCGGLAGTLADIDSETNITFMLTLTAVSMILNIYKSICQMYSGCSEIMDIGKDALHVDSMPISLATPTSNTSTSLDSIMQLTAMDFHLARLQRIYCIPNKPSSFHTAVTGTGEGREQIQELRTIVQQLIERLKTL